MRSPVGAHALIADFPPGYFVTEMRRPVVVLTLDRGGEKLDVTLRRPSRKVERCFGSLAVGTVT